MAQSLAQLKEENAAAEAEEATPPQEVEAEAEVEAVEAVEEVVAEVAEPTEDEPETVKAETEDWMKGDESESQDAEKKFTNHDMAGLRAKVTAKAESKFSNELETLKAENEKLKLNQGTAKALNRPSREQFEDADDPDLAHAEALMDWKLEQNTAKQAATQQHAEAQRKQAEHQVLVSQGVDQHYERAAKLAAKSGISAELYQSSDRVLRQAIDSVFPQGGDAITDALIANLGEGSEMVTYNLGINSTKRQEFTELLRSDQTGIKAAIFLGGLKKELTEPARRKTNAPKPAAQVKGGTSSSSNALKRKYDKAHDGGNTSEAFKIKRQAKKDGADTQSW